MVLTSCPGRLAPVSEGPWFGSAVPVDSGPCLKSRGVDQLSWTSRAGVRGPAGSARSPGNSGPSPKSRGVDQLFRVTRARVRSPAWSTIFPGQIRPVSKVCGFDQISMATWPYVKGALRLTSCPGYLAPVSKCSWCPPAVPDYSNRVRWTVGSLADLEDSCHGPRSRGFDQLSRATRPGSECPQCR